jgi:hypothetical protein
MVSRRDPEVNRVKAADHELTFPIVLQRQWEISREYGIFATPVGYLIDEQGIIAEDVAIGNEAILALATGKQENMREQLQTRLEALRKEFETGQAELEKVERQRISLRETMLRISGAAQVLEEVLLEGQLTRKNGAGTIRTKSDDANGRPADQKLANLPGTAQLQGKFNSSDSVKDS